MDPQVRLVCEQHQPAMHASLTSDRVAVFACAEIMPLHAMLNSGPSEGTLPKPGHLETSSAGGGMGERKGSGFLNPMASSFIPRSTSGGSDVFLTPAPSLASATAIADLTPEQARPPTIDANTP